MILPPATGKITTVVEDVEDGVVAVQRVFMRAGFAAPMVRRPARVVETEIDMERSVERGHPPRFRWLLEVLNRLKPTAHATIAPPMRSVGRELEESWPAREA